MQLYILGRQPALGLAELERLCDAGKVKPFGNFAACVNAAAPPFARLGGSLKSVDITCELPYANWKKVQAFLLENAETLFAPGASGRHTLGLSIYGHEVPAKHLNALLLTCKKQLRTPERSIRIVESKQSPALESAQIIHNGLLEENGRELVIALDGQRTLIGLTTHEQDIESYTLRDRGRPGRDAKVGMLPPKLAQIIINLAAGSPGHSAQAKHIVLDPFCGTGVVLQEALLMGYGAYGSDIDERMVRYARDNLQWLQDTMKARYPWYLERGDAINHTWREPLDAIASETYLGPPLRNLPAPAELDGIVKDCDNLHRAFLRNLAPQLAPGTPLCLAIPAWQTSANSFRHLPLIDDLADLGYNRVDFKHVRRSDLLYYREDQLVARELIVLTRK